MRSPRSRANPILSARSNRSDCQRRPQDPGCPAPAATRRAKPTRAAPRWHECGSRVQQRGAPAHRHQQGSGSTSAQIRSHTKGGLCRPSRPGRLAVAAPWVCELVTTRRTAEPERSTAARPWRCTSPSPPRSRSWDGRNGVALYRGSDEMTAAPWSSSSRVIEIAASVGTAVPRHKLDSA